MSDCESISSSLACFTPLTCQGRLCSSYGINDCGAKSARSLLIVCGGCSSRSRSSRAAPQPLRLSALDLNGSSHLLPDS